MINQEKETNLCFQKETKYKSNPLYRFIVTDQTIIHFHGHYWGLISAGQNISVYSAAREYIKRFSFSDCDPANLEKGYHRLNKLLALVRETK